MKYITKVYKRNAYALKPTKLVCTLKPSTKNSKIKDLQEISLVSKNAFEAYWHCFFTPRVQTQTENNKRKIRFCKVFALLDTSEFSLALLKSIFGS